MANRAARRVNVCWLGEPACHDTARTGGKAATLSRLAADYPVPPGFCLTAGAWAGTRTSSPLPTSVREELAAAYRQLATRCGVSEPPVAVRSSAVDEDGTTASYAGQFQTFLNVAGEEAVVEAVARCLKSVRSDRARAYRRRQNLSPDDSWLAVLVQQLVAADVSAVVFSANPVTGNRDEIVVNASWGLGASVVGGTVTPDTFVVRRDDGAEMPAIVSRDVAHKERMTILAPDGTDEVDVPRFLRRRPALDDGQIRELAGLALRLELRCGWPVDLECAYQDDALYLLQCRPITTLKER